MNDKAMIKELPTDIDPVWAGDGSQLPEWGDYTKVTYLHAKGERIANVTRRAGN